MIPLLEVEGWTRASNCRFQPRLEAARSVLPQAPRIGDQTGNIKNVESTVKYLESIKIGVSNNILYRFS